MKQQRGQRKLNIVIPDDFSLKILKIQNKTLMQEEYEFHFRAKV